VSQGFQHLADLARNNNGAQVEITCWDNVSPSCQPHCYDWKRGWEKGILRQHVKELGLADAIVNAHGLVLKSILEWLKVSYTIFLNHNAMQEQLWYFRCHWKHGSIRYSLSYETMDIRWLIVPREWWRTWTKSECLYMSDRAPILCILFDNFWNEVLSKTPRESVRYWHATMVWENLSHWTSQWKIL
jgi:hypothetical protein